MTEEGDASPNDDLDILSTIKSELKKSEKDASKSQDLVVKKLRKRVLEAHNLDDSDKRGKKKFKKTMKSLEEDGVVTIDSDGVVKLTEKANKKRKKEKKEEKKKGDSSTPTKSNEDPEQDSPQKSISESETDLKPSDSKDKTTQSSKSEKGVPCKGNPQGVTRLFLGNLPFAVDETSLSEFLPETVTHIKWITDKENGKFYGSAFIEMDTPAAAAEAVAMAGSQLMGRPIKINFAPSRPGDVWPPANKVISGGSGNTATTGGQAGGRGVKAMGAKPENCVKLFIGNLSYDIDDDSIKKFFDNVQAEVKAVRWLSHRDTGDFKGCGFVEFWNSEACDKAATLNGKTLLGRPIRIDWTE